MKIYKLLFCFLFFIVIASSCKKEKPISKQKVMYKKYCASCHIAPKIQELPKEIWKNAILPDMVSRMEIEEMYQDPNQEYIGIRPKIKLKDWLSLQSYILDLAPDTLQKNKVSKTEYLSLFLQKPLALDNENGALISYLDYNDKDAKLYYGLVSGILNSYDFDSKESILRHHLSTPITWFNKTNETDYITEVGILDPSELEQGSITRSSQSDTLSIVKELHRPVHTLVKDLDENGSVEVVVSEFGNNTGRLSLIVDNDSLGYTKTTLMNLPGCVKTIVADMNNDGKLDLVSLFSQANESVIIFYQEENLKFRVEKVLEFSPVYGSSWIELIDYNKDGFKDIITVNGDNADKSYVHKPYHGMRIHLNDGKNNFKETYFYPLNGATRVIANDFDQDNDIDFALISSFPDYENAPELSFVYLENIKSDKYDFKTQVLSNPNEGRWFLMDSGDIDQDGDDDIILSSFTYVFTPVPDSLSKEWNNTNTDILVLENQLN
jgi:hypothetical protein